MTETVRVSRWTIGSSVAAALVVVGTVSARPSIVVAATVPLIALVASSVSGLPEVSLQANRTVDPVHPDPGDRATVTLEIENTGSSPLPDVRVVDGVPDELGVVDGSARGHVGLRSGESATIEYDVRVRHGEHAFDRPSVRVRSFALSSVWTDRVETTGQTAIEGALAIDTFPLSQGSIHWVGQVPSDDPGTGLAFHSTREYRRGDPISRVDWRRYAATGSLTTVQFDRRRSSSVVFVLDASKPVVAADERSIPAVEFGLYAIDRASDLLRAQGHRVGLAAIGRDASFVEPRADRSFDRQSASFFETVRSTDPQIAHDSDLRDVCQSLPPEAEVVVVSSAIETDLETTIERIRAYDHTVTVLSPDITGADRFGARVASIERSVELQRAREVGATVVDWETSRPIAAAIGETFTEWIDR